MRITHPSIAISLIVATIHLSSTTAFLVPVPQQPYPTTSTSSKSLLYASSLDEKTDTASPSLSSADSESSNTNNGVSLVERLTNSGAAAAAAAATAAVNSAVAMKTLEAPDTQKSYIALNNDPEAAKRELDEEGLPRVYDKDLIEAYWSQQRGALNQRWSYFVGKAVPFFTKMVTLFIRDGSIVDSEIPGLSKQARKDLQDLGPTFIKAGQMMSVRPDVLPEATLEELSKLQDSVVPFNTTVAVLQIERELGGPLGEFFTSISEEPVAAASLAQVYKATLADGKNTPVAIKVQRPDVLGTVSKDLYVLRRAAEVFQGLVERFAPQQKTNYVGLLNEWAIGFYTELDFLSEATNQASLRQFLIDEEVPDVTVPKVYEELCTRRILVSEWIDGTKLSDCDTEEIARLTPIAQEAFLTQLFSVGFFHSDPHPGNLLKINNPEDYGNKQLAIIDCGLMASIDPNDRDNMISAVVHLANKDYPSLVDDFIQLKILPEDTDRPTVIPLMDKALSPYVKGGGAKRYEEEVRKIYGMESDEDLQSQVGGFQAMTQDALSVLNDVPFSIPPYFAILGRAIVTLEGVALTGDPDYGLIMEAYPFIARKLLSEDRPEIQRALQEVLFSSEDGHSSNKELKFSRLLALLNNAAGSVATQEGAAFVDLDAVPEDGLSLGAGLKYLLSNKAESLRNLLQDEVDSIVDVLSRQIVRKASSEAMIALAPPRPPSLPLIGNLFEAVAPPVLPKLEEIPFPFLLPKTQPDGTNRPSVALLTVPALTDAVAPKLSQDEEIYAVGLAEAAKEFLGEDVANFLQGESIWSVKTVELGLTALRSGVLGESNLLSEANLEAVLETVTQTISNLNLRGGPNKNAASTSLEADLAAGVAELSADERQRLDEITSELTERAVRRVVQRLETVNRIL